MGRAEVFVINTDSSGVRRRVFVAVYDDLDDLRREANEFDGEAGAFDDAMGLAHRYELWRVKNGAMKRSNIAGTIRLYSERLGSGLISHEALHIALGIYRQDCRRTIDRRDPGWMRNFPRTDMRNIDDEEKLCYIQGDLVAGIVDGLYEHGYYKEDA